MRKRYNQLKQGVDPIVSEVRKKILILYASYGDGHIQVSRALQERFELEEGCKAVLVDLFAEAYPAFNALTRYVYIKSYSLFPKLYGLTYYWTRHMRTDTMFSQWFHRFGIQKLHEIIRREQPDAVVNTFPMLVMPEWRKKTGTPIPTFSVLTDFVLHWRWIHPLIDKYYVATDDLRSQMTDAGVPAHRIEVSGIPLQSVFRTVEATAGLYAKYRLDPLKRTVLIMAGSYGVLQGLKDVCDALGSFDGVQLLVVCGKNESLYSTMAESFAGNAAVQVFPFVKEMNEMMALSDVIVTKPGGITLTEAIESLLPIVLFRPVPGQEHDNAQYLASKGAAFIAKSPDELTGIIHQLLTNDDKRQKVRESLLRLRQPQSTERIVHDMLRQLAVPSPEPAAAYEQRRVSSGPIT